MRFRKDLTVKINPDLSFTGMADFLRQYPREARKLGLLPQAKVSKPSDSKCSRRSETSVFAEEAPAYR